MKRNGKEVTLNEREQRVLMSSIWQLLIDKEIGYKIGSMTQDELNEIYYSLKYGEFCERHGIASWHDMDEFDHETYAQEQDAKFEEVWSDGE